MKDVLDVNRLRTVGLPGLILAVALHPFVAPQVLQHSMLFGLDQTILFLTEIVFYGLVFSSGTRWFYYLYEGYRLPWLTRLARSSNERRVDDLLRVEESLWSESEDVQHSAEWKQKVTQVSERLSDYVLDSDGRPVGPTLLANIIASYERYAKKAYDVDGNSYWHHIRSFAPDSIKAQLEDHTSLAQSLVLGSFAFAASSMLGVFLVASLYVGRFGVVFASSPVGLLGAGAYVLGGICGWFLFYRLALTEHRSLKRLECAAIDLGMPGFVGWLRLVRLPLDAEDIEKAERTWHQSNFGLDVGASDE